MKQTKINFQAKQEELEQILGDLQSGNLSIDQSITEYQKANEIIDLLEEYLKTSQNQITKVLDKQTKN